MILNAFTENFRHKLLKCKMLNKMLLRFFFLDEYFVFSKNNYFSAGKCTQKIYFRFPSLTVMLRVADDMAWLYYEMWPLSMYTKYFALR